MKGEASELDMKKYRFKTEGDLVNFYLKVNEGKEKLIITQDEIYLIINEVRRKPFQAKVGEEKYASLQMLEDIGSKIEELLKERWGLV
jgi:hypothetical protein